MTRQEPVVQHATAGPYKVELSSGKLFSASASETLIAAAARAGIPMPYSCKSGRCSTCKCKVISGVTTALQDETGLSAAEQAEGWILSCVRAASSDLMIEAEDLAGVDLPPIKTLPCRISSIATLAPDVLQVYLRLPATADFRFIAGQYIDIIGPGGNIRRSYSLANASRSDKTLELHIRAVDGGAMSEYWFKQARPNDLLRLNGPLGTFFLRDAADVDLVFLATGTGIAPVKAILESLPHLALAHRPKSVTVVWGGRIPSDLYFDIGACGDHQFIPVLSRAGLNWQGARGYVQDVLIERMPDLSNATVYACGSDSMIHGAKEALVAAGLSSQRFYSDAFVCSDTHQSK